MMREPSDSNIDRMLEREIEELLKVDVPADFLPRLHARIQDAPRPSVWTFRKMYFPVTTAVVFAAVLALAFIQPHKTKWETSEAPVQISSDAATPETPPAEIVPELPPPRRVELAKERTNKPELLISAEETRAIRRLLEGQVGPLPANLANSLAMPEVPGELVVPQIAIKPVEVPGSITVEPVVVGPAITEEGV